MIDLFESKLTIADIKGLPRWAKVAFAVRCARTVEHLYKDRVDEADVNCAINIAELLAREGGNGTTRRARMASMTHELAQEFFLGVDGTIDDEEIEGADERGETEAKLFLASGHAAIAASKSASMAALSAHHACVENIRKHDIELAESQLESAVPASLDDKLVAQTLSNLKVRYGEVLKATASVAALAFDAATEAVKAIGGDHECVSTSLLMDCRHLLILANRLKWSDETPIHLNALRFSSCFVSYSVKDERFADRLHHDLVEAGVLCWK